MSPRPVQEGGSELQCDHRQPCRELAGGRRGRASRLRSRRAKVVPEVVAALFSGLFPLLFFVQREKTVGLRGHHEKLFAFLLFLYIFAFVCAWVCPKLSEIELYGDPQMLKTVIG